MELTLVHLIGSLLACCLLGLAFWSAGPTHGLHHDPVRDILHQGGPRIKSTTQTSDSQDDSSFSVE